MKEKLMSDERQNQIVQAVAKAADLHVDGMSATEAIIKTAGEIEANDHVLQRMVEAFNTSKTLAHFRTSEGSEKSASFDLADYDAAKRALFPEGEAAKLAFTAPYDASVVPDLRIQGGGQEKAASDHMIEVGQFVPAGTPIPQFCEERRTNLAWSSIDYWRKEAAEQRHNGDRYRLISHDACEKLGELFRQADRPDWSRFETEALTVHGDKSRPFLDAVYEGSKLASVKCARATESSKAHYVNDSTDPHKLLKVAMFSAELCAEAYADAQVLEGKHAEAKASLMGLATEKVAIGIPEMLQFSGLQRMVTGNLEQANQPAKPGSQDLNQDVGLESELSKARLQTVMRDMMTEDDVIGQHASEDPDRVMRAVEDLSKLSPHILNTPIVLRTALRRQLEMGGTEPHELKQIKDVMAPQGQPQQPQGSPQ